MPLSAVSILQMNEIENTGTDRSQSPEQNVNKSRITNGHLSNKQSFDRPDTSSTKIAHMPANLNEYKLIKEVIKPNFDDNPFQMPELHSGKRSAIYKSPEKPDLNKK